MAQVSILFESAQQEKAAEEQLKSAVSSAYLFREEETVRPHIFRAGQAVKQPEAIPDLADRLRDLHLEDVIRTITRMYRSERLCRLYQVLCPEPSLVLYRQAIMQDLESRPIYAAFCGLQQSITDTHRLIKYAQEARHPLQQAVYQLNAMLRYCQAVESVSPLDLLREVRSEGLKKLLMHVQTMLLSQDYLDFSRQVRLLNDALSRKNYRLSFSGEQVLLEINRPDDPDDYFRQLDHDLFAEEADKFSERSEDIAFWRQIDLCQLESEIIMYLEQDDPELFSRCRQISLIYPDFIDPVMGQFFLDFPFYAGYVELMQKLLAKGFYFTYPIISSDQPIDMTSLYHLSLALQAEQAADVVANDLRLEGRENGASITGANQGGKTTLLCSLGQAAWFAALGLPICARSARLPLFTGLYTHFAKAERSNDRHGKLSEEIASVRTTVTKARPGSLVLMNELFMSTTVRDACAIGRQVIRELLAAEAAVFIAGHIPDLADDDGKLASLVAEVLPGPENRRTYKIIRRESDGRAYAIRLAQALHLTYDEIKERILNESSPAVPSR